MVSFFWLAKDLTRKKTHQPRESTAVPLQGARAKATGHAPRGRNDVRQKICGCAERNVRWLDEGKKKKLGGFHAGLGYIGDEILPSYIGH